MNSSALDNLQNSESFRCQLHCTSWTFPGLPLERFRQGSVRRPPCLLCARASGVLFLDAMTGHCTLALVVFLIVAESGAQEFDERRDTLVKQLAVWDPKPSDISSHPVSFLMARLKNELGRADKTLPAIGILSAYTFIFEAFRVLLVLSPVQNRWPHPSSQIWSVAPKQTISICFTVFRVQCF